MLLFFRPRERYFAERKLKYLEPELKKWKEQYENLRKFRKAELNKLANSKLARIKRNARRKKRREWILQQVKEGKLHKSALIWVNSTKVLPFEKQEKAANSKQNLSENEETLDDISEGEEDLSEAVVKEPKDRKGKVKKTKETYET